MDTTISKSEWLFKAIFLVFFPLYFALKGVDFKQFFTEPAPVVQPPAPWYADTGEIQFNMYEEIKKELIRKYQIGTLPIHNESPKGTKEIIAKVEKKYGIPFDARTNILAHPVLFDDSKHTNNNGYAVENLLKIAASYGSSETLLYLIKEKGADPNMLFVNNNNIIYMLAKHQKWTTIRELVEAGVIKDETLRVCVGTDSCEATIYDVLMANAARGLFDAKTVVGNAPDMRRLLVTKGVVSAWEIRREQECFSPRYGYTSEKESTLACGSYIYQMSFRCEKYHVDCEKLKDEIVRANIKTENDSFTEKDWLDYIKDSAHYNSLY